MTEEYRLTLAEAASAVRDGSLSPVDLTQSCLDRAAAVEPSINAFIEVYTDSAFAAAKELEQEALAGNFRGPLHGVPVAAKDIFDVAGSPTTAASPILAGSEPKERDSAAVDRLRAAGAIILGKLNLHEFAYGATGVDSHAGPARNPWNSDRVTGGSSSGSGAAVAAGECFAALGTDTGGSIRIPASLCGIVGIKPTFGRVSRRGVFPLSWSLDHVGPMSRTVEDTAIALQVLAGHDPEDRSSVDESVPDYVSGLADGVKGLKIGASDSFIFTASDEEIATGVQAAISVLEGLGAEVKSINLPHVSDIPSALSTVMLPEALAVHRKWMQTRPDDYSEDVRYRLELGATYTALQYVEAQRFREMVVDAWRTEVFEEVDLLVMPATALPAPAIEGSGLSGTMGLIRCTNPINFLGIPAISVPCGFTSAGLPFGLQIAGRWWDEATVLRAAHAYEQATDWKDRKPPL
jgi:aspartyl-tRNA(Asn)/glutamyl-tRNA(Gln) amidotransferase subunit A